MRRIISRSQGAQARPPMDVLRTLTSALSYYDPENTKNDHDANVNKAIRLTSQIAMLVANYDRIRKGKPLVEPDRSLSHAANFLLMLNGTAFTNRRTGTGYRADPPCGSRVECFDLRRPCDGCHAVGYAFGDNLGYRRVKRPAAWRSERGGVQDPDGNRFKAALIRSSTLRECWRRRKRCRALAIASITRKIPVPRTCGKCRGIWEQSSGNPKWFDYSKKIEHFIQNDKKLNANVDFYSASTYHTLGIDVDLFTPIFAVSRVSGWTAHMIEQLDDNRLIRPRADYIGPVYPQKYVAMEKR